MTYPPLSVVPKKEKFRFVFTHDQIVIGISWIRLMGDLHIFFSLPFFNFIITFYKK